MSTEDNITTAIAYLDEASGLPPGEAALEVLAALHALKDRIRELEAERDELQGRVDVQADLVDRVGELRVSERDLKDRIRELEEEHAAIVELLEGHVTGPDSRPITLAAVLLSAWLELHRQHAAARNRIVALEDERDALEGRLGDAERQAGELENLAKRRETEVDELANDLATLRARVRELEEPETDPAAERETPPAAPPPNATNGRVELADDRDRALDQVAATLRELGGRGTASGIAKRLGHGPGTSAVTRVRDLLRDADRFREDGTIRGGKAYRERDVGDEPLRGPNAPVGNEGAGTGRGRHLPAGELNRLRNHSTLEGRVLEAVAHKPASIPELAQRLELKGDEYEALPALLGKLRGEGEVETVPGLARDGFAVWRAK